MKPSRDSIEVLLGTLDAAPIHMKSGILPTTRSLSDASPRPCTTSHCWQQLNKKRVTMRLCCRVRNLSVRPQLPATPPSQPPVPPVARLQQPPRHDPAGSSATPLCRHSIPTGSTGVEPSRDCTNRTEVVCCQRASLAFFYGPPSCWQGAPFETRSLTHPRSPLVRRHCHHTPRPFLCPATFRSAGRSPNPCPPST